MYEIDSAATVRNVLYRHMHTKKLYCSKIREMDTGTAAILQVSMKRCGNSV